MQYDSTTARPALHTAALTVTGGPTGITTRTKGAWQSVSDFVLEELAKAQTADGTQWTILNAGSRTPNLRKRDKTTVAYTYTAGTPGVDVELSQDWTDAVNVIYGEAQDEAGSLVRNLFIGSGGNAFYQPFAFDTDVHNQVVNESTGALTTSGTIDASVARVERFYNFGEGINRGEVKTLAERYLSRDADPGWSGRITLSVDPEESVSRLQMKAGENVKLKYFHGLGATGVTLHIAGVEHRLQGDKYVTTLTVDSKGRDLYALEEILRRSKQGNSPARRLRAGRESGTIVDRTVPWDGKQSGWLPTQRSWDGTSTVSVSASTWKVEKIVMAGGPLTIVKSQLNASTAVEFGAYVFDWAITSADLPSNPFAEGAWDDPPDGFIVGWGVAGQHAGYSPGLESDGDGPTGVLLDEGTWDIPPRRGTASSPSGDVNNAAVPPFLWVAIWCTSAITMHGRFYHGG